MDKYESYAVGYFLSSYPEDWSFTQITQAMREGGEEIWPWSLFEDVPMHDMAELIEEMVASLRAVF
jgi:hypothetical protein